MAKNDFKSFATAANANVTPQANWEALPALLSGFTAGKAASAQVNKALRQATFIAAALAQYTADKSGQDVLDDGDAAGFIEKMSVAFGKDYQALDATLTALAGLAGGVDKLPYFTGLGAAGQTDLTQVGRDIIGKATITDIVEYLGLQEDNTLPEATKSTKGIVQLNDSVTSASTTQAATANAVRLAYNRGTNSGVVVYTPLLEGQILVSGDDTYADSALYLRQSPGDFDELVVIGSSLNQCYHSYYHLRVREVRKALVNPGKPGYTCSILVYDTPYNANPQKGKIYIRRDSFLTTRWRLVFGNAYIYQIYGLRWRHRDYDGWTMPPAPRTYTGRSMPDSAYP